MSIVKSPFIGNSLVYYPILEQHLDQKYGGPRLNKKSIRKYKGDMALRLTLECLSIYKNSSCEDIAEFHNQKFPGQKKILKSLTDDLRKFIKNNLLPLHVVQTGIAKIEFNRDVKTYKLTSLGILYTIHLFSHGNDYEYNLTCIRNLAKEYSDTLPRVFGRFKILEEIIGENFEYVLGLRDFNNFIHLSEDVENSLILSEYVQYMWKDYRSESKILELIPDQISFIVYHKILENLPTFANKNDQKYLQLEEKIRKFSKEQNDENDPEIKIDYIEHQLALRRGIHKENAIKKWQIIIREDDEIKKWYTGLMKKAIAMEITKTKKLVEITTLF